MGTRLQEEKATLKLSAEDPMSDLDSKELRTEEPEALNLELDGWIQRLEVEHETMRRLFQSR